jgi:hypothetical protein
MILQVTYQDASEPDCCRVDYIVTVDGTEHCLAPSALGTKYNDREAIERARMLFGPGVCLLF